MQKKNCIEDPLEIYILTTFFNLKLVNRPPATDSDVNLHRRQLCRKKIFSIKKGNRLKLKFSTALGKDHT